VNTATLVVVLVGSNVACLFLGYLFGRLTRATVEIEETMEASDAAQPPSPEQKRKITALHVISLVVVAIGLVTAVVGYQITRNQDRIVGCVVGYSNAAATAAKARAHASNVALDQLDAVMDAVAKAYAAADLGQVNDARTSVRAAIQGYVDARHDAKEAQRKNPLPEPPQDACADLLN